MIVQPVDMKEVQERVLAIFQSLMTAMAAVTSRYSAAELATIAAFFRETTEVLRNETIKLRHIKQHRAPGNR